MSMKKLVEIEKKSKSQVKRELQELQALGKQLTNVPNKQLVDFPLSEKLRDAILAAKTMKQGALSRQLKYIGGLMPDEDIDAVRVALNTLNKSHQDEVDQYHQIEIWRDRLLEGDEIVFDELMDSFASFDRQHVNQLLRNAKNEQRLSKPPKSARMLFKYLAEIQENETVK